MKKTILIYNPSRYSSEVWLPTLWSQAKTYYEKNGKRKDEWHWYPAYADIWADDFDKVKEIINKAKPDVFAISLYVWSSSISLKVAKWVKEQYPNCLIISGGPQQDFKYNNSWFVDHPYIDCSLPGENYGELCFAEILDNYNGNKLDYNTVSDLRYPLGKTKQVFVSKKHQSIKDKKAFDYNWSSFADQQPAINDFINYQLEHFPKAKRLAVFETTRGCPYGCTYCDWGGGINTAVIKKDGNALDSDLKFLSSLNLTYLYIADANFGIFNERDVDIIKKLVSYRTYYKSNFRVGYGGFAKTENKLPYIKEILTIDLDNQLSNSSEIKISLQSLDTEVLKNIDRKNISLDKQFEMLYTLSKRNKLPIYAEMILGLPGMTLEKFYKELNVLGEHKLSAMWFEWLLLPETPAFDPVYKKKFGIKTISKLQGWSHKEAGSAREIVVGSSSLSEYEYLETLLASSLYHAFIQGGVYSNSINWITTNKIAKIGDIIKFLVKPFITTDIIKEWDEIMIDPTRTCEFNINGHQVYGGFYFAIQTFLNVNNFIESIGKMLTTNFQVPNKVVKKDQKHIITKNKKTVSSVLAEFMGYKNSGHILQAKNKFLNLF